MRNRLFVVALLLTGICAACGGGTAPPTAPVLPTQTPLAETLPTETPTKIASIADTLPNLEYEIELASTGKAQLKDGAFEEAAAPNSATKTKIWLAIKALGDVNGDGAEDALVTLVVDPGGSGTFTYLVLVLNDGGAARPLAAVLLGDRIVVKSLELDSGNAVVSLLMRRPDEPMSAEPTVEETLKFKVQGDQLVEE